MTRVARQAFGDGVVAVFAGVVANYVAATYGGAVAVFNVAAVVGVVMALACASLWEENYGSVRAPCRGWCSLRTRHCV